MTAERLTLLEDAETAVYPLKMLHKISGCGDVKIHCFVDNKRLIDARNSCEGNEDRKLRIDMAVLRDTAE